MDPVSNVDRLVSVLRQRLAERARARTGGQGAAQGARQPDRGESLQALAAIEGVDDRQLGRAVLEGILAEEFGQALVNEAKFQQIVDRVAEAIAGDQGSDQLMSRTLGALRASAARES
ncbi:MAG TPA: hypothetical protein VF459_06620 [Caulobacteraceae bacterium]